MLPQRYPFRLVERVEREEGEAVVVVALSADATVLRGAGGADCSLSLAVEILAQSALLLLGGAAGAGDQAAGAAFLGGIDEARLLAPLVPGDRLRAYAAVAGRLGAMVKLATRLERDGERVAEAALLLVRGPGASVEPGAEPR